jgi:hypothetical protein
LPQSRILHVFLAHAGGQPVAGHRHIQQRHVGRVERRVDLALQPAKYGQPPSCDSAPLLRRYRHHMLEQAQFRRRWQHGGVPQTEPGVLADQLVLPAPVAEVAGVELVAHRNDEPRIALRVIGAHRLL